MAEGRWFSCQPKAGLNDTSSIGSTSTAAPLLSPGWTNYTSCYTETTLKLFKDLDYETGCPKDEVEVNSEVKVWCTSVK